MATITVLHDPAGDDPDAQQRYAAARRHLLELPPLQQLEYTIGALEQASGSLRYLADYQTTPGPKAHLASLADRTLASARTLDPRHADRCDAGAARARWQLERQDVDAAFDAIADALHEATAALMLTVSIVHAGERAAVTALAGELAAVAADTSYAAASRPSAAA